MCRMSVAEKVMNNKAASRSDHESAINTWENDILYFSLGATRYLLPGGTCSEV